MTVSKHMTFRNFLLAATILGSPLIATAPTTATAQAIEISVQLAPPVLPIYSQPPLPGPGYIWTPGYWQWAQPVGYYWVPGTWILPPEVGMLWTPPYWGWGDGAYLYHAGYWGPHVGYYGGVNYGFGYGGVGYDGGRWDGGTFNYNRTVNNFGSVPIAHAYDQRVAVVNNTKVSYVGGAGGLKSEPTAAERAAEQDRHAPLTAEQTKHIAAATKTPALAASHNNGRPAIAATSSPAQFTGAGVVRPQPVARTAVIPHPAPAHAQAAATSRPVAARTTPHPQAATTPHPVAARTTPHPQAAATPHPVAARTGAAPHPAPAHAQPAAAVHPVPARAAPAPAHAQAAAKGPEEKPER